MKASCVLGWVFFSLVVVAFVVINEDHNKQMYVSANCSWDCNTTKEDINNSLIEDGNWETYEAFGWYNYTINRSEWTNYSALYCNSPSRIYINELERFNYSVLADYCDARNVTIRFINGSYRICYNQSWVTIPRL